MAEASQSIETTEMLAKLRTEIAEMEEQAKIAADPAANLPLGWNVAYVRSLSLHWHVASAVHAFLLCIPASIMGTY